MRVLFRIGINDDLSIQESQNVFQDGRPSRVLFVAGHTPILDVHFPSVEEVGEAVIADDVTLNHNNIVKITNKQGKVSP